MAAMVVRLVGSVGSFVRSSVALDRSGSPPVRTYNLLDILHTYILPK